MRSESVRGASLMVLSSAAQLFTGIVSIAFLARLLTPTDFGIFAMAGFLIGIAIGLRDFGIPMATVQAADLVDDTASALFWLNLKLSGALFLMLAAAGPILSWFFGYPVLVAITAVLGAGVALSATANVHNGLLLRRMRFGAVATIEVLAAVLGAVAGIAAAYAGAQYWALVIQQGVFLGGLGVLPWLFCDWRPHGSRAGPTQDGTLRLRSLVHYSKDLSLARLVTQIGSNLDYVLIGRFAGAGPLGLYHAAFRWAMLPIYQIYLPLTNVVVATQSRLQDDVDRYRASFRSAVRAAGALVLPLLAFLFAAAGDVILLLLGPQWIDAVPMFQALVLAAFCDVGRVSCRWAYLSEGRMRRQLHWTLISTPLLMIAVAAGLPWGARGVAVGYAAATAALVWPGVVYCLGDSVLRMRDFWEPISRPALAAIAGAAVVLIGNEWAAPSLPLVTRLVVQAAAFVTACIAAWMLMPGGRHAAGEMLGALRATTQRSGA